jgi:Zn-dependent protease
MKTLLAGRFFGLDIWVHPSTWFTFAILWLILGLVGYFGLRLNAVESIAAGLICTGLHYFSELWHNIGHAIAARRTGYPMVGVVFWAALASSRYPREEPELPARVHITRALGGPAGSGLLALAVGLLLIVFSNLATVPRTVAYFFFIDNLLVFTIGALIPLGFTDGGTLVKWWGKKMR